MKNSVNNQLVVKPYAGSRGIKANISKGVAVVQQKTAVIGLEVLMDAHIIQGNVEMIIKKGSTVYIKEEVLYTHKDQYSRALTCDEIKEPFILANFMHVVMVKE